MKCIGIDIGKSSIYVCTAIEGQSPKKWPVLVLDLEAPSWFQDLLDLVEPGDLVALEPTGWYYSRPVVAVVQQAGGTVLHVAHHASKATRIDRISSQKTDANDARALAVKAADYAADPAGTRGIKTVPPELADLSIELRITMNAWKRAQRASTSAQNRLDTYARGIWPALSQHKNTWLKAVTVGAVTPDEVKALADLLTSKLRFLAAPRPVREAYAHGNTRRPLVALAALLPAATPPVHPAITEDVLAAFEEYRQAEQRIAAIEEKLAALVQHPALAAVTTAWMTFPGATIPRIAALHAAANCQAQDFSADGFRAAVGCHPSRQESGQVTEAKATKRGYRAAKGMLHLWTMQLLNPKNSGPNAVRSYFEKLQAQGNKNAMHAARGKLARMLSGAARAAGRGEGGFFDPATSGR